MTHFGRATFPDQDDQPYRPTTDQFLRNSAHTGQLHRWHLKQSSQRTPQEEKPKNADVQEAENARQAQQDEIGLQQLFLRLLSERQKSMAEMWKILRDTHTDMFQILQQAWLYRAKAGSKAMGLWANYLTDVDWKDW